ncbi:L-aspartate oxidase (LASPO) (Quinolinate synthetase B) [Propionibacterium freudenreichii]|uniref:FAD-dependent oxidoreductase n=1 Tax=Propionibacterium freudenreichii TaxID=1744 RepID=UPI000BC2E487|nr:FAD-dependent oxidoreductase [Propionibacterium freudenreichii]MCT2972971.1 FAD-dependent oxidoreductase [Propionibacterium freudenreichii]MDK9661635.1 FAD-dependent oxidoreductase [Propionibacterium freudenreichii]SBN59111.1 L-aspartate oxidase (LASPO) (Quinolinate synthetase B) [Propionibacterium freudenreichii]SCQ47319.1 L-aspartate oxidase (LASPO) (Quinolinate synthetase B) [Propionibacterium freudenreichii]SCQ50872.1 L-aspartate oxidase (LASPO) (Quinolinate synthetase B) [Propionibacte
MSTSTRLGRQLEAPAASWTKTTRVVVVGGGAAGLSAALPLAAAQIPVTVICRSTLLDTATARSASRATGWRNPPTRDQMSALGDGLTNSAAAEQLITEAPALLDWLASRAHEISSVDQDPRQPLGMTLQRTLASVARVQEILPAGTLTIDTHSRAIDVLTDDSGRVSGLRVSRGDGTIGDYLAGTVVLAAGGAARLWTHTTAPGFANGDGLAMALRAGALLRDLEFVAFSPTALDAPAEARLPGETAAEMGPSLRQAGAELVDAAGSTIVPLDESQQLPDDELAIRLADWMAGHQGASVFLDARGIGDQTWQLAPHAAMAQAAREHGINPARQVIPVRPAAQAFVGGVAIDEHGATSVPGLYAAGEVAASGANGASGPVDGLLIDALATGTAVGRHLAQADLPDAGETADRLTRGFLPTDALKGVREAADTALGLRRDHEKLRTTSDFLARLPHEEDFGEDELTGSNLQAVAAALSMAATARPESRGWHRRIDHTETSDKWAKHVVVSLADDGTLQVTTAPLDK